MRGNAVLLLPAVLLALCLAGCGGVPEDRYDEVCAERNALRAELEEMKGRAADGNGDTVTVTISGSFTATVRYLVPDYVYDDKTPHVALVTLFQSTPFALYVGGLAEQLEPGGTYVFEIKPAEGVEITAEEYERGVPSPEEAIPRYGLRVSGFREAEESDYGLEASHLVFET